MTNNQIIVAKQRNGPTGTTKLAYVQQFTRFENLAAGRYTDDFYPVPRGPSPAPRPARSFF